MAKTISEIGEFGLIAHIHKLILEKGVQTDGVRLSIGDDTAAIEPRTGFELLVTCDCLVEGRHYLPDHIIPLDLGRRAMAVNISDIGAMGGLPLYSLVSLGLREDTLVTDVESIYHGFLAELHPFQASIIGGNITRTDGPNFIDITMVGEVEKGNIVLRSTAEVGDAILVTGFPGQAVAGLQLLLSSLSPQDMQKQPLVQSYNTPKHRAREGHAIACSGYAKAMIDTSDGLLSDLGHICEESKVGAEIFQKKLPLSKALHQAASQLNCDPYDLILSESDDYELILTCAQNHVEKIQSRVAGLSDTPVTEIGRITVAKEKIQLIIPDGRKKLVTPSGWDHFKT
jgi:thiamine-monophosphate kinase